MIIFVCENCYYKSINEAINKSNNYDTIIVKSGTYYENIKIEKPITLIGESNVLIDGRKNKNVVEVISNDVKIMNFKIINSGYSEIEEFAGIKLRNVKNCEIKNNTIENNFFGVYLENVQNCRILDNKIFSNIKGYEALLGNGIHAWKSNNLIIKNNVVYGHRDGIYFEFVNYSIIENNKSFNNLRYGLHFMFSKSIKLENSTFRNNRSGIALMYSSEIIVKNNYFIENFGTSNYGLLLKEVKNSSFEENIFRNNTNGVYLENSINNEFFSNLFEKNNFAIRIMSNCENNNFEKNKFINNLFEVLTNSTTTFNNRFYRNYWDKYIGYDRNKDGFGDEPYRIVKISNFLFEKYKLSIILLNSLFISFLEFIEKLIPSITPNIYDKEPIIKYDYSQKHI